MTEQAQGYSAQEFLAKLQRDELSPPLRFTGMAKKPAVDTVCQRPELRRMGRHPP
jgi:hypothetical protein